MVVWGPDPRFKLVIGAAEVTWENDQAISVYVTRLENAIDSAVLVANDYRGRNYLTNINNLDALKVYFCYLRGGSSPWELVFQGEVESIQPQLNNQGQVLAATARSLGFPLLDMHVCTDYGVESKDPTIDNVTEIMNDIRLNYVNKRFGVAASGHNMTQSIDNTSPTWDAALTYVPFPYKTAFEALKTLCDLGTAVAAPGNAGPHFIVAPPQVLCVGTVGSHSANVAADWPTWWNTDRDGSTFVEGVDFLNYNFQDDVKNYFNHIVYAGSLLKPGTGDYCENNATDWDVTSNGDETVTNEGPDTIYKVGLYSIKAHGENGAAGGNLTLRYKKNVSWGYNVDNWGGVIAHPTINFWIRRDANMGSRLDFRINKDSGTYAQCELNLPTPLQWYGFSLEIGPYGHVSDMDQEDWFYSGGFNWKTSVVNWVYFLLPVNTDPGNYWVDGFNFQGQVIRCATDTAKIGPDKERQRYIFDSVGKDDTTKSGTPGTTDTGFMAKVAKAELFRCAKKPKVGSFTTPLNPTVLAGQLCHVHAGSRARGIDVTGGPFNFDADYRITEVRHSFITQGATTTYTVTSDVINGVVNRPYSMANMIVQQLLGKDREGINLRSMNIDLTTPRLTENYAT